MQLFANNSNDFYDYNRLPTRYKNGVALLNTVGEAYEQDNYKYRWKKNEVDNKYRELFGNGKEIESNDDGTIDVYKSVSTDAKLNSDENYYYSYSISPFSWTTAGGELIEQDFFKILNATLNGDNLEVTFKYATIEGVINKSLNKYNIDLYSKINLTGNDINETLIEEIDCSKKEYNFCNFFNSEYTDEMKKEDTEKIVSKYSDKLDTYKYTFKYDKEHKNYYFYSIEKIENAATEYDNSTEVKDSDQTKATDEKEDKQSNKYILNEKTDINSFCPEDDCNKKLGIVKIGDKEYDLSVNLKKINSYETTGTISLGNKKIDIRNMDLSKDTFIYSKIEGFEIYNEYFIVYLRSKTGNNNTHGYSMQIYDEELNKVSGLDGYTCGSFKDFKIENGIVYYNVILSIKPDIYDSTLNYNNYYYLNVNKKILFEDLISENYNNSQLIDINYSCGMDGSES